MIYFSFAPRCFIHAKVALTSFDNWYESCPRAKSCAQCSTCRLRLSQQLSRRCLLPRRCGSIPRLIDSLPVGCRCQSHILLPNSMWRSRFKYLYQCYAVPSAAVHHVGSANCVGVFPLCNCSEFDSSLGSCPPSVRASLDMKMITTTNFFDLVCVNAKKTLNLFAICLSPRSVSSPLSRPSILKQPNACIDEGWYIVLSTFNFQVEAGFMRINQKHTCVAIGELGCIHHRHHVANKGNKCMDRLDY